MGQCKSRKSVDIGSITNGKKLKILKALNPAQKKMEKSKVSRGEATSFGFKSKPSSKTTSSNSLPSVAASVTKETIEPIVIPTLPKNGTTKGKPKKEVKSANRFGFRPMAPLSNKVADLQDENKLEKEEPKSPATNAVKNSNKFGYKGSKGQKADPLRLEIEQLEESPSVTHKYRQPSQQKRPNEITFTPTRNKTFSLRDLDDNKNDNSNPLSVAQRAHSTPIAMIPPQLSNSQISNCSSAASRLMNESTTSIESCEEKHKRDLESSEKDCLRTDACVPDEMWGHGEAMALEEGLLCLDGIDQSPEGMNLALRSVLLKIEDPTFACLAAMSRSGMLEDEKSPESLASPDLSSSPTSVEPIPIPQLNKDSPGTPVSPTHGSNSCSSDARERDFLIDDEIADQPGLIFNTAHQNGGYLDMAASSAPEAMASLAGQVSKVLASLNESPRPRDRVHSTSLGTLSPCDSLASDDLMVDFDSTGQTNNFNDLDEVDDSILNNELEMQRSQVMKEWNSILTAHPGLSTSLDGGRRLRSRVASRSSVAPSDSPKSQQSSISSPRRPNNLGNQSPQDDVSVDSGIRVDKSTYQVMFQEVINIKTMLFRLKRVLDDSEAADPFDKNVKNGSLFCSIPSEAGEGLPHQLADMRRQIVLMQHQLEEKDRIISQHKELIQRLSEGKQSPTEPQGKTIMSNAATQTEKVRPLSSGPILFQTSNEGAPPSLVSCMTENLKNGGR